MTRGGLARPLPLALLLAALCCAGGCRSTIKAGETRPSEAVPEEMREHAVKFFRRPLLSHLSLSPSGEQIAAIFAKGGVETLVVRPTRGGPIRPLAKLERTKLYRSQRVRRIGWAGERYLIVSIGMPSRAAVGVRARQSRLLVVDLEGGRPRYLGEDWRYQEYMQFQDDVISWLPDEPEHVLVNLWMSGDPGVGARRLNVVGGGLTSVVPARPGLRRWFADHRGQVRVGWGRPQTGVDEFLYARIDAEDPFEQVLRWDPHEEAGLRFAAFDPDPALVYVRRNDENGRLAVYRFDLRTRELGEKVFAHRSVDVSDDEDLWTSSVDGRLVAIPYATTKPKLHFVDREWRTLQSAVDAQLPGRVNRFVGADRGERRLIVYSAGDIHPPRYYLFDRDARRLDPLVSGYPELEGTRLAPMEPVEYTARDGLVIPAYLTRPVGHGDPPFPSVLLPHGGPWARDVWGWDARVQFLASLGFAVLQPNFRGSQGYGQAFEEKGYGAWGEAMQDDLADGARWLVEQGVADPERIGIFGGSYGGFAALLALAREPELFRAGASFAGVTDVVGLLGDEGWYLNHQEDMQKLVGDRIADQARLREISPALRAAEIRAPVLVGHGTEDSRVHVKQAHAMIDALEDAGGEVVGLLYDGELHGFIDDRNAIDFYAHLGTFFERQLAAPPVSAEAP